MCFVCFCVPGVLCFLWYSVVSPGGRVRCVLHLSVQSLRRVLCGRANSSMASGHHPRKGPWLRHRSIILSLDFSTSPKNHASLLGLLTPLRGGPSYHYLQGEHPQVPIRLPPLCRLPIFLLYPCALAHPRLLFPTPLTVCFIVRFPSRVCLPVFCVFVGY